MESPRGLLVFLKQGCREVQGKRKMHVWSHEEQSELKDGHYQLKNGFTDKVDTEPFTVGILYCPCLVPTSAGSPKSKRVSEKHLFLLY